MTHICVRKLTIIGSDNGLSPGWRQAIIWTNAGMLMVPLGAKFSEILVEILTFSLKKCGLMCRLRSGGHFVSVSIGLNIEKYPIVIRLIQICSALYQFIYGNIFALLAIRAGYSPVPGEFPAQRPVTRSFVIFFDLRLNKRLSKQSWGWLFEMLSCPLWRHCNVLGAMSDFQPLSW